jgi:hypothetical protein
VYDPHFDEKTLTFGVSGKLCKSNLLMYDRQTDSLWSQLLQQAITGPLTGKKLKMMLTAEHTSWESWRSHHPETLVLSPDTGFKCDYGLDPYEQYHEGGAPMFSLRKDTSRRSHKLRPMERVLGVQLNGLKKAYPFSLLKKSLADLEDRLGTTTIRVDFDSKSESGFVTDSEGRVVPSVVLFWFARTDFYPDTLVYAPKKD